MPQTESKNDENRDENLDKYEIVPFQGDSEVFYRSACIE
jgi:hypothetical protein